MGWKLASISAFLMLCGPFSAQGFDVFQDPDNIGNNPRTPGGVPEDGSLLILNVYVQNATPYLGWDIEIKATGDVEITDFDPDNANVVANLTGSNLLRANRVDPTNPQTGYQRVGALTVKVNPSGGTGSVDVTGNTYVTASPLTASAVTGSTLASTSSCVLGVDSDQDGVEDCDDNCPYKANDQQDNGGINTSVGDGIGDACQCGDVNGDGRVSTSDGTLIKRTALGLGPYFNQSGMPQPYNCDVNGTTNDDCSTSDGSITKRAALGLPPGIQQVCRNAHPPAQP
jgi:hypothetical protein